jgi:hypothetical protein
MPAPGLRPSPCLRLACARACTRARACCPHLFPRLCPFPRPRSCLRSCPRPRHPPAEALLRDELGHAVGDALGVPGNGLHLDLRTPGRGRGASWGERRQALARRTRREACRAAGLRRGGGAACRARCVCSMACRWCSWTVPFVYVFVCVCVCVFRGGEGAAPHLDGLEGAQRNVGEELGRGRARQVDQRLVLGEQLLARRVGVRLLRSVYRMGGAVGAVRGRYGGQRPGKGAKGNRPGPLLDSVSHVVVAPTGAAWAKLFTRYYD